MAINTPPSPPPAPIPPAPQPWPPNPQPPASRRGLWIALALTIFVITIVTALVVTAILSRQNDPTPSTTATPPAPAVAASPAQALEQSCTALRTVVTEAAASRETPNAARWEAFRATGIATGTPWAIAKTMRTVADTAIANSNPATRLAPRDRDRGAIAEWAARAICNEWSQSDLKPPPAVRAPGALIPPGEVADQAILSRHACADWDTTARAAVETMKYITPETRKTEPAIVSNAISSIVGLEMGSLARLSPNLQSADEFLWSSQVTLALWYQGAMPGPLDLASTKDPGGLNAMVSAADKPIQARCYDAAGNLR